MTEAVRRVIQHNKVRLIACLLTFGRARPSKIKHFRRIATRYDKLARNYAGFYNVVAALKWCL